MKRNRRQAIAIVLAVVLCFLCGAGSTVADENTIIIGSVDDLLQLSENCKLDAYSRDKTVYLETDLSLDGVVFVPIPTFGGVFDGQGHTISGLSLEGDASHMGLFRYVQEGGTVKNLTVTGNIDATGTMSQIGAVVGTNMGTISGCNFSGTISGAYNVGGIAGTNEPTGMIYNCKTEGYTAGDHYVGGIVGQNLGTVSYCSNTAGVNLSASESTATTIAADTTLEELTDENGEVHTATDVGGIAGFSSGVVIGCTNWGRIGYEHIGFNVGGIVGRQSGLVSGSTNWGNVSGRKDVGGIAGQMEPFIAIDMGAGSAAKLEGDLNSLHDLVNVLLVHTGDAASAISATIGAISNSAASATEHARYVAEQTANYVDDATGTLNELMLRINTAEKMVSPAITEFSQSSIALDGATRYFSEAFDQLDAIDEMTPADKDSFKSSANDLATTSERLNASMAYLGWLMKAADNSYGTGNYDLVSERPDNWQEMSNKYGYVYDPDALTNYESIRDAMLRGVGDAASAAGLLSGDISTMTRIINLYYLSEDQDGNTRLDNTSFAFKNAFTTMRNATGHLSTGMSYLDQVGSYLSGNEPLTLQGVDSDFRTAMEGMFDDLGGVSTGLSQLATQSAGHSMQIIGDMQAVNDQFNVVMVDLVDILQLALNPDMDSIIEDVSEVDPANTTNGKVFNCENYGKALGDINAGGIAGCMAIEYDFSPENDSNAISGNSLASKYSTKCILADSRNYGSAISRRNCAGGICGDGELGLITGCQGYGTAESTGGDYVGGIVGLSKGAVRSSWAKCEATGGNWVGGIAGYGKNISDCSTLVNLNARENCVGTIAGELDGEGTSSGNVFVHDTMAGIDGISYAGSAEALTYQDFMTRENVPAEFSSFTATFTANGEIVKTITFGYGGSIDESEIPECPPLEGNYGKWPDMDYTNLTFDMEIKAIYSSSASVVEGDLVSGDSNTPVVLVQGVFDPAATVHVEPSSVKAPELPAGQTLEMNYQVRVENDVTPSDEDQAVDVRVYAPDVGRKYTVYAFRDGKWEKVSTSRDGSYLVFKSPDRDITFALARGANHTWLRVLIALAALLLLAAFLYWLFKRRRNRSPKGPDDPAKAMPVYPDQPITPVTDEPVRITVPEDEPFVPLADASLPVVEVLDTPETPVFVDEVVNETIDLPAFAEEVEKNPVETPLKPEEMAGAVDAAFAAEAAAAADAAKQSAEEPAKPKRRGRRKKAKPVVETEPSVIEAPDEPSNFVEETAEPIAEPVVEPAAEPELPAVEPEPVAEAAPDTLVVEFLEEPNAAQPVVEPEKPKRRGRRKRPSRSLSPRPLPSPRFPSSGRSRLLRRSPPSPLRTRMRRSPASARSCARSRRSSPDSNPTIPTGNNRITQKTLPTGVPAGSVFLLLSCLYGSFADFGQRGKAALQLLVAGDVVRHQPVIELLIGYQIEIARAGQAEDDRLLLAGLLALHGLVDRNADRVAALRRREDALHAGEKLRRLEHLRLLHGRGLHVAVVVELRERAAHAVEAQAAGVVRRGDEGAAERVHLRQRADHARVAEVIGEPAAREARAALGLHGDDAVVRLAAQLFAHERGDQTTEIRAAAGAADDHIGLHAVFVERGLRLQTDDRLVQQHLIEHAAEHVAVAGVRYRDLHGLRDRAAERAGRAGELLEDLAPDVRRIGRGGRHLRAVGAHHLAAERLLLIGALDHEHLQIESQIGAGHAQCCAPLAGAGLGRHAFEPLVLRVVGLRDGGVQLVAAAGVVALKLVVDVRRGAELLLQTVRAHQRRGAVHLVKVADLVRDRDVSGVVVKLLLHQLVAEHDAELLGGHGQAGAGIQQGSGLRLHVRPDVVPCFGDLAFGQIDLVGDFLFGHFNNSFPKRSVLLPGK